MKKIIHTALFATVAGALTFGAAASLQVNASNLGAGSAPVSSCDTDGVTVDYGLMFNEPELVNAIVVSDIDAACNGQALRVSVSDELSAVIGVGDLLVSGTTMIIPITPMPGNPWGLTDSVPAAEVSEVSVTISGAGLSL